MYTMQNSLHRGITPTVTKVVAKKLRLEGTEQLSAVGLENFFVASSRGTEQLLRQELQAFRIGKSLTLEEGGVRVDGSSGDLCKTVLLSRLADRVLVTVGASPQPYKSMRDLFCFASSLPWENYINYSADMEPPIIRVVSPKSSKVDRLPIVKTLTEALLQHKKRSIEKLGDFPRSDLHRTPRIPMLQLQTLRHGGFKILMDATGFLGFRSWREKNIEKMKTSVATTPPVPRAQRLRQTTFGSAVQLLDTQAAAVVVGTCLFQTLSGLPEDDTCVIWDPFSGSGAFLLELMAMLVGQRPRQAQFSHGLEFPFTQFPCHDNDAYLSASRKVRLTPHLRWNNVKFFGCNGLFGSLQSYDLLKDSLRRFLSSVETDISPATAQQLRAHSCVVPGISGADQIRQLAPKRCVVLTALPCAGGPQQHVLLQKFGTFLRELPNVATAVVVAAAPANSSFSYVPNGNYFPLACLKRCSAYIIF